MAGIVFFGVGGVVGVGSRGGWFGFLWAGSFGEVGFFCVGGCVNWVERGGRMGGERTVSGAALGGFRHGDCGFEGLCK